MRPVSRSLDRRPGDVVTAAASLDAKPYKGPLSYEIEDGAYFFGRDREADLLVAKILSSRFTLLHAQSGTGKTSLLNARVIPALEEEGWGAFRILLRKNPSEAVRTAVLFGLLPPPETEAEAIARVVGAFWAPGEDPTLNSVLDHMDYYRSERDSRCRDLLRPLDASVNVACAGIAITSQFRPLFLRLLGASLQVSEYREHVRALAPAEMLEFDGDTRASVLIDLLRSPAVGAGYADLLGQLYSPVPSLREYFTNLRDVYGAKHTQFQVVLILDQFEELFTLFADSPAARDKQLWRLRWEFLEQLEGLNAAGSTLPIRYVISMRDEYIAQLDPLRRFIRDLDVGAFHLSFLEKEQARASILEPARLFGYTYSDDCCNSILDVLVREDRFVEPAPLQIVCERLWQQQGSSLAAAAAKDEPRAILLASLPDGGTRAILDAFFEDALRSLGPDQNQLEALEMLEPLVTGSGTRNIVEYASLVNACFRQLARREALLTQLEAQRIIRIEHRLGGRFVEITHEFLIASILGRVRMLDADPSYGRLRWSLRTLEHFEGVDFRSASTRLLDSGVFGDLDSRADDIRWTDWSTELMLRTAIAGRASADTVHRWAQRYRETGHDVDFAQIVTADRMMDRARSLLSPEELAMLSEHDVSALSRAQVEFVFRSQLRQARAREPVARWTRELRRACNETPF